MANLRPSPQLWWQKWAKKDWAIAAAGFIVIVFTLTVLISNSSQSFGDSNSNSATDLLKLTLLKNAKDKGARRV